MTFFHATPTANVESILRDGLLTKYHSDGAIDLSIFPWSSLVVAGEIQDTPIDDMTVLAVDLSRLLGETDWIAGTSVHDSTAFGIPPRTTWGEMHKFKSWLIPGDDGFGTYAYGRDVPPSCVSVYELDEAQWKLVRWMDADDSLFGTIRLELFEESE